MNISPNDEKIEKYLNELSNEYKTLLYKALISRSKPLDEPSVSELLRLDNEIKKPLFEDYQKQKRYRHMLSTIGLTYIFMGAVCYFLYIFITNEHYDRGTAIILMSGVVSIIGMVMVLYSFTAQNIKIFPQKDIKSTEESSAILKYEVVNKWRELEGMVNDISLNTCASTPRSSLDYLLENHFIDEEEYNILKVFLKIRNSIVHSNDNLYSESDIKETIDKVNKIIDKIKKFM